MAWGPSAYNRVVAVYHHPIVQIMELGLVGAVIYPGLNGLRVMIIDFGPKATANHQLLFWGTCALRAWYASSRTCCRTQSGTHRRTEP